MNHPFARSVRLSTSHALRVVVGRTAHGVCLLLCGLSAGVSLWVGCAVGMGQSSTGSDLKSIPVKEPERGEKVSYSLQIAELLENKCTGCHGSVLAEKRLNLESVAGMLKGGKRGPAIVPGKADESLMFKMAAHRVLAGDAAQGKAGQQAHELAGARAAQGLDRLRGRRTTRTKLKSPKNPAIISIVLGDPPPGVQPINAVDMTG